MTPDNFQPHDEFDATWMVCIWFSWSHSYEYGTSGGELMMYIDIGKGGKIRGGRSPVRVSVRNLGRESQIFNRSIGAISVSN